MESCLVRFLRDPQHSAPGLSPGEWQMLIRQARRSNLLSRMAHLVETFDLFSFVPEHLQSHLLSAQLVSSSNLRSVKWEILQIYTALSEAGIPFALLKGAAYVMSERDAFQGRLFGDIDILVRNEQLKEAEKASVWRVFLEVRPDNTKAQKLYKKAHFKHIATREAYYPTLHGTAEDALVFARDYPGN